jgi:hypothetical protein
VKTSQFVPSTQVLSPLLVPTGEPLHVMGAVLVAWIDPEVGVAVKLANGKNNDRAITASPRETPSRWNIISWSPYLLEGMSLPWNSAHRIRDG